MRISDQTETAEVQPCRSLLRRAVVGTVLAELLCLVALAAVSVLHERETRLRAMSVMLQGRTDSLFGGVQDAEDQGDSVHLDAREVSVPPGDYFAVYNESGKQIGGSESAPFGLLRLRAEGEPPFHTERVRRHSFRVLQRNYQRIVDRGESPTGGVLRPVTIVYATELDRIWREVFQAIEFYLGVSVLLTVVTTGIVVLLLRSALQPIAALAAASAAVSPRDLIFLAPPEAMAIRELRPLGLALSAMIEELRLTFDRQHRFLGDAAHELKTAVAIVKSSLQLMLLRPRSAASYEQGLESAVADSERAEQLISRMLFMARLEELPDPRSGQVEPLQVLRASVEKLWPLVRRAELQLAVTLPKSAEGEELDAQRLVATSAEYLDIAVTNLLVNAVEHSSPGSRIDVCAENLPTGVRVTIADQGDGIAPDAVDHIFERFYRADQSRARVTGGAGLGLSIVKAIVEGAGGTISVRSRLNEGTEMIMFLPFCQSAEDTHEA